MDNSTIKSTNRLLQVVIALLLRQKKAELLPLKQQIGILHDLGLRPIEIAEILGRTGKYVGKEIAGIRKSKKPEE